MPTVSNTPWRKFRPTFYPKPNPHIVDYDRNCIQQIKDAFISFVKIHGRAPENVTIGPYEMQEVKKAHQAGVTMEVTIDGIKHVIPILESTNDPK